MVLVPIFSGVLTRAALPETISRLAALPAGGAFARSQEAYIPTLGLAIALPLIGGVLAGHHYIFHSWFSRQEIRRPS